MSATPRIKLVCMGGPFDGCVIHALTGFEEVAFRGGHALYIYQPGELVDGNKIRRVLRFVQVVPNNKEP